MPEDVPETRLRLLTVVAHPHDVVHVAGTMQNHIEHGDSVTLVSVTGGIKTHHERLYDELQKPVEEQDREIVDQSTDAYGKKKAQELRDVCGLFGITDVRIFATPQPVEVTNELVQSLVEVLYEVRPHILVSHPPNAYIIKGLTRLEMDDHMAAGLAVHKSLLQVAVPDQALKRAPHQVAAHYYTGCALTRYEVDLFVDVSDRASNHLQAEMLFDSQAQSADYARKRIDGEDMSIGHAGWCANVAYAEPFVRASAQVGRYLEVTEHDLETAGMAQQDVMARVARRVQDPA